jgi:hypothetical protein
VLHHVVEVVAGRPAARRQIVGGGMRVLPRCPQTIDVAVVQEEDGVIGRSARPHVATDPDVDAIVKLRSVLRRRGCEPPFQPVAKAACAGPSPR